MPVSQPCHPAANPLPWRPAPHVFHVAPYAATYRDAGFYPSYAVNAGRYAYDPLYAHERWQHRQDPQWEARVAADFVNRRDHEEVRPPGTWAAQRALGTEELSRGRAVAAPLEQWAKSNDSRLRFQAVDASERQRLDQHGQAVQRFREDRQKLEAEVPAAHAERPSAGFTPARVALPRSPIMARPAAELGKEHVAPPAHAVPRLDPRIEPRPREDKR